MAALQETTIRDFGGGWDVADSDKALTARFQPVSDNIVRGIDGHWRVRYGKKLFANLRESAPINFVGASTNMQATNAKNFIIITHTAHGRVSGDHVTFNGFTATTIGGISTGALLGHSFGIVVINANSYKIYIRATATSNETKLVTHTGGYFDNWKQSGRDLFGRYYRDHLFVFSSNGEITAVNQFGVATIVWNYQKADALTVEPWGPCDRVSAEIIRGRLVAVNGALNDKPLVIENVAGVLTCNYLVDQATLSNGAIPRAEFVIAADRYVVLANTEYGPTMLEIGAKNTVMTCSREASPDDAVEVDLGMLTQTVDSTITAASVVRSRVFIGFADRSLLGSLGVYTDAGGATKIHEPDFNDNVAEFGTFSHATVISLGNDLLCAGLNGVSSLEMSRQMGEFSPKTLSDLIHPVLLRHINRLSEYDRKYRTFSVYDSTSRSYMLFMPKYSENTTVCSIDAVTVTTTLQKHNIAYLHVPGNRLDAGDYINISGVTNYDTVLLGSMINGKRKIRAVLADDIIVVDVDPYPIGINASFGGNSITVNTINDETTGYVFEYNIQYKIRRWTRFRGWNLNWGAKSQLGRMFFGKDGKIWMMGDINNPISSDRLGDYDFKLAATNVVYSIGTRVFIPSRNAVYKSNSLTPVSTANWELLFATNADSWIPDYGVPIEFDLQTSWTDFKSRMYNKQIEFVRFDTIGKAEFNFSVYKNSNSINFESLLNDPDRVTAFVAEHTPGFGAGTQNFGGGRNTRQEWLHSIPVEGKLFKFRWSGSTIHPLQVNAATFMYHQSKVVG